MQRRKFIQQTGAASMGTLLLNGLPIRGLSANPLNPSFTCQDVQDRILVMINLFGANDSLNTLVPMQQYSIYAAQRPNIKIPETGPNKYIVLDNTLPSFQQTALHPIMTPFKTLYDAGKLNVVHGVGYANGNRSHFKSDELWNTAGDSTPANYDFDSGWAGQLMEYRYPGLLGSTTPAMPDPPCIEVGSSSGSTLFQTSNNNNASVLLTSTNVTEYYNTLASVGGPAPATYPISDYGVELKYVDDIQRLSNFYAQRIQALHNAGSNTVSVTYPNTYLAQQLKTIARIIKGGSKSSIFLAHQYGYDTHGDQAVVGNPTTGQHTNLLKEMTEAVMAFQTDIEALGFGDRILTATYSEFGRTINENSGHGTDHGESSSMFIIGKGVQPGVTGEPIDLTQVVDQGLTDLQYDYRQVWAALLQDFMGHGNQPMIAARMNAYTTSKPPIVSTAYKAAASCYINQISLPVTLAYLKARLVANGAAEVYWSTTNESDCKHFVIEHSANGVAWHSIGTVTGSGNSTTPRNYTLLHSTPTVGTNYYRMWQYDYNGNKRAYGPVTLQVKEAQGFSIKSYPNPAQYDFNIVITADKKQKATLQFMDAQGHLLAQEAIVIQAGFNKYTYDVHRFKNYKGELIVYLVTELGIKKSLKQIVA